MVSEQEEPMGMAARIAAGQIAPWAVRIIRDPRQVRLVTAEPVTVLDADAAMQLVAAIKSAYPEVAPEQASWDGYGPPADPDQWQLAAEWLWCQGRHGDAIDNIVGTDADTDRRLAAFHVYEEAADMVANAAERVRRGHTEEACCPEKQRMNRGATLDLGG